MVKLVISDMDGTLIDRDEILSDKAVKLTEALKKQGILFTIATGRVQGMAGDYVRKLDIQIPYIACNGVTIVQGEQVLRCTKVPLGGLRAIIRQADSMGMTLVYSIDGYERIYRVTPWIESQRKAFDRYHQVHVFTEEEWETLYIDKLMIMDDIRNGAIAKLEELCRQLPDIYGFTRYTNKSVEIVSRESTKGAALREVAALLGIDMKEVLAVGDHKNDLEMITAAGIGVAVANAIEELKQAADYVAKRPCVDGVQEALEVFCGITLDERNHPGEIT